MASGRRRAIWLASLVGPPPQNIETETALQAVTRSVSQCKTPKPQNQVGFSGWSYPVLDAVAEFYAAKAAKDDVRWSCPWRFIALISLCLPTGIW